MEKNSGQFLIYRGPLTKNIHAMAYFLEGKWLLVKECYIFSARFLHGFYTCSSVQYLPWAVYRMSIYGSVSC
jgi:hypothetical protein